MTTIPSTVRSDIDLFSDEVLQNPYPAFKTLRDLGPAAYLEKYGVWHIGRYRETAQALRDWQTFSSGSGCGLNDIINNLCQKP